MRVIANTTVISNFASCDALDVLRGVVGELPLAAEVYAEVQDGLLAGYAFYEGTETQIHPFAPDGWLRLVSLTGEEELQVYERLSEALGRGEAASLAIAACRGWGFLSDDAQARKAALARNVPVSGTIGVLMRGVATDDLSLLRADSLLQEMIRHGYRSPHDSLAELMQSD